MDRAGDRGLQNRCRRRRRDAIGRLLLLEHLDASVDDDVVPLVFPQQIPFDCGRGPRSPRLAFDLVSPVSSYRVRVPTGFAVVGSRVVRLQRHDLHPGGFHYEISKLDFSFVFPTYLRGVMLMHFSCAFRYTVSTRKKTVQDLQ